MTRKLTYGVVWAICTAIAVVVGLVAVNLIGDGLTADRADADTQQPPVQQVSRLARSFDTAAGSTRAECRERRATLVSWSPAQGWSVHEVREGPAREVEVEFAQGDRRGEIKVRCVNGKPNGSFELDNRSADDDTGDNRGRGGDDGRRGGDDRDDDRDDRGGDDDRRGGDDDDDDRRGGDDDDDGRRDDGGDDRDDEGDDDNSGPGGGGDDDTRGDGDDDNSGHGGGEDDTSGDDNSRSNG